MERRNGHIPIDISLEETIRDNRIRDAGRSRSTSAMTFAAHNDLPWNLEPCIYISNLFHEISEADLHELFSQVVQVKRVMINYDRAGRSMGTAKINFRSRNDADIALERFQDFSLEGHPVKIEIGEIQRMGEGFKTGRFRIDQYRDHQRFWRDGE